VYGGWGDKMSQVRLLTEEGVGVGGNIHLQDNRQVYSGWNDKMSQVRL